MRNGLQRCRPFFFSTHCCAGILFAAVAQNLKLSGRLQMHRLRQASAMSRQANEIAVLSGDEILVDLSARSLRAMAGTSRFLRFRRKDAGAAVSGNAKFDTSDLVFRCRFLRAVLLLCSEGLSPGMGCEYLC
ncbi:hypothetical protein [Tahibacter harae]|uniref:Uncharacterized protein n=1 Tax=Tahibacter harae TaxID=2963937 RepID=A0ABT1QS13_9GAMM|nr:hypothetical protein [Tahibacter harae]MCQ4165097.1 hypothetical protein [Tahibacter harae]